MYIIQYADSFYGLDDPMMTQLGNIRTFATCELLDDAKRILNGLFMLYPDLDIELIDETGLYVETNEGKRFGFQYEIIKVKEHEQL